MAWLAGIIPLLSLLVGVITKWLWNKAWIGAVVTLGATYAIVYLVFAPYYWPWLWLYVAMSWFGSWMVFFARDIKKQRSLSKEM